MVQKVEKYDSETSYDIERIRNSMNDEIYNDWAVKFVIPYKYDTLVVYEKVNNPKE